VPSNPSVSQSPLPTVRRLYSSDAGHVTHTRLTVGYVDFAQSALTRSGGRNKETPAETARERERERASKQD